MATLLAACAACGGKLELAIPPPPPSNDAGAVEDAGQDATFVEADAPEADAPEAGAPDASELGAWCAANAPFATLCDDFDLAVEPRAEWSVFGAPSLGASTFASAPRALEALGTTPSYLAYATTNAPYGAKLEAELYVAADGASATEGPVLAFIDADHGEQIELSALPGTGTARCSFGSYLAPAEFALTRGEWHSLSFKISFNADGTNNFFCSVDGVTHGYSPVAASQNLGKVTLGVGARGTTTSAMDVSFDDVVIDM